MCRNSEITRRIPAEAERLMRQAKFNPSAWWGVSECGGWGCSAVVVDLASCLDGKVSVKVIFFFPVSDKNAWWSSVSGENVTEMIEKAGRSNIYRYRYNWGDNMCIFVKVFLLVTSRFMNNVTLLLFE